jgi:hypothetical protein
VDFKGASDAQKAHTRGAAPHGDEKRTGFQAKRANTNPLEGSEEIPEEKNGRLRTNHVGTADHIHPHKLPYIWI